jgi:SAM-dependent methyltransferase
MEWLQRLDEDRKSRRSGAAAALDVAMGRGRHALPMARAGWRVFGVDLKVDALRDAARDAKREGLQLHLWCADLTQHSLPRSRFDLVVVTRYLQRDLFPAIRDAVAAGGIVIYETFTTKQLALGVGPKSPDHLLVPGELRDALVGFDVLFYEETESPEAVARLVARRPQS